MALLVVHCKCLLERGIREHPRMMVDYFLKLLPDMFILVDYTKKLKCYGIFSNLRLGC